MCCFSGLVNWSALANIQRRFASNKIESLISWEGNEAQTHNRAQVEYLDMAEWNHFLVAKENCLYVLLATCDVSMAHLYI